MFVKVSKVRDFTINDVRNLSPEKRRRSIEDHFGGIWEDDFCKGVGRWKSINTDLIHQLSTKFFYCKETRDFGQIQSPEEFDEFMEKWKESDSSFMRSIGHCLAINAEFGKLLVETRILEELDEFVEIQDRDEVHIELEVIESFYYAKHIKAWVIVFSGKDYVVDDEYEINFLDWKEHKLK